MYNDENKRADLNFFFVWFFVFLNCLSFGRNSRKSLEENDKWDHKSIVQSPFHSFIMMRKSELTWSFVCLIICLSELFVFWSGPGARLQGRAWWSCLPQGCAWSPDYWQGTGGGWTISTSYNWTTSFLLFNFRVSPKDTMNSLQIMMKLSQFNQTKQCLLSKLW